MICFTHFASRLEFNTSGVSNCISIFVIWLLQHEYHIFVVWEFSWIECHPTITGLFWPHSGIIHKISCTPIWFLRTKTKQKIICGKFWNKKGKKFLNAFYGSVCVWLCTHGFVDKGLIHGNYILKISVPVDLLCHFFMEVTRY